MLQTSQRTQLEHELIVLNWESDPTNNLAFNKIAEHGIEINYRNSWISSWKRNN